MPGGSAWLIFMSAFIGLFPGVQNSRASLARLGVLERGDGITGLVRMSSPLCVAKIGPCAAVLSFVPFRKKIIDPRIFLFELIHKSEGRSSPKAKEGRLL
jgi:hypothetical protein